MTSPPPFTLSEPLGPILYLLLVVSLISMMLVALSLVGVYYFISDRSVAKYAKFQSLRMFVLM